MGKMVLATGFILVAIIAGFIGYGMGRLLTVSVDFRQMADLLCGDGGGRMISVMTQYGNTTIICRDFGIPIEVNVTFGSAR